MGYNRLIQFGCLAAAVLCVGLAGVALVPAIEHQRRTLQLDPALELGADAPPSVALTTVMFGPFRGLAVDYLWYRSERLKEEGSFFEANQLSQWITTLQPHFPRVWNFLAWNMAYNISVQTDTPEERWGWVQKGINLLRDQGIPQNPRAISLYQELSWIIFHKIGRFSDDMHWFYKAEFTGEWQELLGAPTVGAKADEVHENFRQIAEAPSSEIQLLAEQPKLSPLVERLKSLGYQLDQTLLRQIGRIHNRSLSLDASLLGEAAGPETKLDEALAQLMKDDALAPLFDPLVAFLRRRVLEQDFHMDVAFMFQLMRPVQPREDDRPLTDEELRSVSFGPLDWRHYASHACYWAALGTVRAVEERHKQDVDMLNTYRHCIHALQELTRFGSLSYDPVSQRVDMMPDPRFIPAYEIALQAATQHVKTGEYNLAVTGGYEQGHENFLLQAIVFSYLYGDIEQAELYRRKAGRLYGHKPQNRASRRYTQPLSELVLDELSQTLENLDQARQFIDAMLARGYMEGLSTNRPDVFNRFLDVAQLAHRNFNQRQAGSNPQATQGRLALLPFDQLLVESYSSFMRSYHTDLLQRARIWANTPYELRQRTFERLRQPLYEQALHAGLDPKRAFPEPPARPTGTTP